MRDFCFIIFFLFKLLQCDDHDDDDDDDERRKKEQCGEEFDCMEIRKKMAKKKMCINSSEEVIKGIFIVSFFLFFY